MSFLNDITTGISDFATQTWDLVTDGVKVVGEFIASPESFKKLTDSWDNSTGADVFDQSLTGYAGEGDMMSNLLPDDLSTVPDVSAGPELFQMAAQNPEQALDTSIVDNALAGIKDQAKAPDQNPTWAGGIGSNALVVGGKLLTGYQAQKAAEDRAREAHKDRIKEIEVRARVNRRPIMPWR